jgi:hypothetical protein
MPAVGLCSRSATLARCTGHDKAAQAGLACQESRPDWAMPGRASAFQDERAATSVKAVFLRDSEPVQRTAFSGLVTVG